MYCGMSPSRFCSARVYARFPPMNVWNSSLDCAAPPPDGPTPPSSAYWVHRSLSTVSAHRANCRSATSPFESLPVLRVVCALPSVFNKAPADKAAPAMPMFFRNERRSTTRCQRESRSSTGAVAVVSVETVVARFSFFTCSTLRSWDSFLCVTLSNVKLRHPSDIPQIEKYFLFVTTELRQAYSVLLGRPNSG